MDLLTYTVEVDESAPVDLHLFHGKMIKIPEIESLNEEKATNLVILRAYNHHAPPITFSSNDNTTSISTAIQTLLHYNSLQESPGFLSKLPVHPHSIPSFIRETARKFWPKADVTSGTYDFFPNWPIDYSVDFLKILQKNLNSVISHQSQPTTYALSHDVDTDLGQRTASKIADIEESLGFRSTWFVVPGKYKLDLSLWKELEQRGHEIACHGLLHDYKLTELSQHKMRDRLRKAKDLLGDFHISGFRSPGFYRNEMLINLIGQYFDYDSSIPDTLCLPGPGGCGTVFADIIGGVKQVPVTVPWDGELMSLGYDKSHRVEHIQEKCNWINSLGGLIHLLTHPDPGFTHTDEEISFYKHTIQNLPSHAPSQRKLLCEIANSIEIKPS